MRTIAVLGIAGAALAAAAQPAAATADVGGLIGGLIGGGSQPPQQPPSQPPPTQQPSPSEPTGPTSIDRSGPQQGNPLLAPESSCHGQTDSSLPAAAQERVMACMLSYARVARGLPPLHSYKPLRTSAGDRAREIRQCQQLSHHACGRDLSYLLGRVGFMKGSWIAGEVLAVESGQRATALGTTRAWLASAEHRAVLFHRRFDLIGVGTVRCRFHGVRGTRIWVAHLGHLARR